jgi:hypothetical protein
LEDRLHLRPVKQEVAAIAAVHLAAKVITTIYSKDNLPLPP